MTKPRDVKSASRKLLVILNKLSPFSFGRTGHGVSVDGRGRILWDALYHHSPEYCPSNEYRTIMDLLNQKLDDYARAMEVLLYALEELNTTRRGIMEERFNIRCEAAESSESDETGHHLPNEILSLIASYKQEEPISIEEAVRLRSSRSKWDEIVLKASVIKVDGDSFKSPYFQQVISTFGAKLAVDLSNLNSKSSLEPVAIQSLLRSRNRWQRLSVGSRLEEGILKALCGVTCPNCPPPSFCDGHGKCENHTETNSSTLQSFTFTVGNWELHTFLGMLTDVTHLNISIVDLEAQRIRYGKYRPVDFSGLASAAPLLSELSISWRWSSFIDEIASVEEPSHRVLFPNLKKVSFLEIYPDHLLANGLKYSFNSLDGSNVEELCLHILRSFEESQPDVGGVIRQFAKTFPSVRSLALRVAPEDPEYDPNLSTRPEILEMQSIYLKALQDEKEAFPRLTHLSVELDQSNVGVNTLVELLESRRLHRGPSSQEIQSVDLFASSEDARCVRQCSDADTQDFYKIRTRRIKDCVERLTFRGIEVNDDLGFKWEKDDW